MEKLRVEVINIGTELLNDKLNTNIISISDFLAQFNLSIDRAYSVKDDKNEIKNVLYEALDNCDIVFTTGGLGPTIDDLTKEAVSEVIQKKLFFSEDIFEGILSLLRSRGRMVSDDLKNNLKNMAYIIEDSLILKNHFGTAPGILCNVVWKNANKTIIILPGPPDEMKSILYNDFFEYLQAENWLNFKSHLKNIKKLEFQIFGLSESEIDIELRNILQNDEILSYKNEINIETAILINSGLIYVGFSLEPKYQEILEIKIDKIFETLKSKIIALFGNKILAYNNSSIQELVVKNLLAQKKTIATAESCTGGLIAKMITDISGSSECFTGGIVSYSNDIKIKELDVNGKTIEDFGAVSHQTAIEMAEGILRKFETDYAIATTGIAGPSGGTLEKPLGLVYIAVAAKNEETQVLKLNFGGDRDTIRQRTSTSALAKLLLELQK